MPTDNDRYRLALDEGRRALEHQATELASTRGRAISLVSVGGVSAAFIGGLAARDGADLTVWTVLGVIAYVALVGASVAILWPWKFRFVMYADELAAWAYEGDEVPEMDRNAATYMDRNYRLNAQTIDRFMGFYVAGLILLLAEITFLLLDLRG